jgi:hypothetical protein
MQPITTANDRLLTAVWIKVDCLKIWVLMWIPGSPG